MIALFHPAMTLIAIHSELATGSFNGLDFIGEVPKFTANGFIMIKFGISPEILNIMCVGTLISLMTKLQKEYF